MAHPAWVSALWAPRVHGALLSTGTYQSSFQTPTELLSWGGPCPHYRLQTNTGKQTTRKSLCVFIIQGLILTKTRLLHEP